MIKGIVIFISGLIIGSIICIFLFFWLIKGFLSGVLGVNQ